jgi:hypothetical protein
MGEKFLAEKAKRFKQRQEQKRAELLDSTDLLTAIDDHKETLYRFYSPEQDLGKITPLLLVDEGREAVSVFAGNTRVGQLDAPSSSDARELLRRFRGLGRSLKAYVHDGPDWTGYYTAKLSSSKH